MRHPSERFQKLNSDTLFETLSSRPRTTLEEPAERQGTERVREAEFGEAVRFNGYGFQKHLAFGQVFLSLVSANSLPDSQTVFFMFLSHERKVTRILNKKQWFNARQPT